MNNFPYFCYLFSKIFNSYHFKGEKQVGESALTEITEKISKESGIKEVDVNNSKIAAFRKKMYLLKSKVDSPKKNGDAKDRRLLDKWKSPTALTKPANNRSFTFSRLTVILLHLGFIIFYPALNKIASSPIGNQTQTASFPTREEIRASSSATYNDSSHVGMNSPALY